MNFCNSKIKSSCDIEYYNYIFVILLFMSTNLGLSDLKDLEGSIDFSIVNEDVKKYIDQLKKDLSDAREEKELVSKNLASRNKIISNLESNTQLQKKRYTRLQDKFNDQTVQLNRTLEELKLLKSAESHISPMVNDQIQQLKRDYEQDQRNKVAIIQNLNHELNKTKQQLSNKISEISTQNQAIQQLRRQYKQQDRRKSTTIENLNNELNKIKNQISKKTNENNKDSNIIQKLNQQIQQYKSKLQNKTQEIQNIRREYQRNQNSKNTAADQTFQKKYLQMLQQKSQLLKKNNDLQKQIKDLSNRLNQSNSFNKDLNSRQEKLEETLNKLKEQGRKSSQQFELILQKNEIDEDLVQAPFPFSHQETIQNIDKYLKSITNTKEKMRFLNIIGAFSENKIDQISNQILQKSD